MADKFNKPKNIYKIYQLMEFFTKDFSFNNVMIKELMGPNEVWLSNEKRKDYSIIRISLSTLDETFTDKQRIDQFISVLSSMFKTKGKFLDIHVCKEEVSASENYDTICLDTNYISGKDVSDIFPNLESIIHDVNNEEQELQNRISSINESIKSRFYSSKSKLKNKFQITITNLILLLCVINFLLFKLLTIKGYSDGAVYIVLGADYKLFTLGLFEIWRLITYSFVHSSFIHFILNAYSFYILGNVIEKNYGKLKYSIILFGSIIFGSLTHGILTDNTLMVGLSGGIYGLFMIYILYMLKLGAYKDKTFILMLALNLGLNFTSNIAWQAHLGGAIAGLIFYFMFKNNKFDYKITCLLVVALIVLGYKYFTNTNITPLYLGTDIEVVEIYEDFGLNNISTKLEEKIYNYYINH